MIITIPSVSWRQLREADLPHLHGLMERGAVGLMPTAAPSDADPGRSWAALAEHDVILLDLSAPGRAGERQPPVSPRELSSHQVRGLRAADEIIGDVLPDLSRYRTLVLVVSPESPEFAGPKDRVLGPIIRYEARGTGAIGLLTSASTRWPGLLTAADLAPTVLSWFGEGVSAKPDEKPDEMSGRAAEVVAVPDGLARLDELDRMLTDRYRLRFAAVTWYLAYGGVLLAAALAFSLWWRPGLKRLGAPAVAAALGPIGLLFAPVVGLDRAALHLVIAGAIAGALALVSTRARRPGAGLAAAILLGSALIVLDVVLGSPLMRRSTMGFGVMFGSRFYGIGNEYMGFLGAMAVIGLGSLVHAAPRARGLAAVLGAGVVLAIGAPWWGANWGGAFAAAAGLVAWWLLGAGKSWPKSLAVGAAVLAVSALIPLALDMLRPAAARSHIGASGAALLAGDVGALADTIQRKVALNWGLLVAYRLEFLLGILLAAAVMWALLRRGGPARRELERQPGVGAGIVGAVVLAVVAMMVNDSGVVAAAAALGVAVSATIFVASRSAEVRA